MKLFCSVFLMTSLFFTAQADQGPAGIVLLFGSESGDKEKFHRITTKTLNESDFAILFLRTEGYPGKEIVQRRKETVSLHASGEIDFDLRVTERYPLVLGLKEYALLSETVREEYSKKKLVAIEEIPRQLPDGPTFLQTSFSYYDHMGNILMKETKKDCAGIGFDDYKNPFRNGQMTFAVSDNGERFSFCYSCNNPEGLECYVYSPLQKQSLKLKDEPQFNRTTSFSRSSRYFVFQHSKGDALTFVDLETGVSSQILWSEWPKRLQAFDDGTFTVSRSDYTKVYFDIQGREIKKDGEM